MAKFEAAIGYVLVNEGAKLFTSSNGEYSKYGITLATAVAVGACQPGDRTYIENLNLQSATEFYQKYIWAPVPLLDGIANQKVATKLFDMIVNEGASQAIRLAQRACNSLGQTLVPDGKPGYQTLTAINAVDGEHMVMELCAETLAFYRDLVTKNPTKYAQFWDSWKQRGEKRP